VAIPVKEKTWSAVVYRRTATGNIITNHQYMMYNWKTAFLTAGWTVARSCDGVSVADADLWDGYTKCVWNTGSTARSWIVLRAPVAMHPAMYVLIGLCGVAGTNGNNYQIIYSSYSFTTAYTGGSTTTLPTAAGEVVIRTGTFATGGYWLGGTASDVIMSFNAAYSSDGTCFRTVFCTFAASPSGVGFFDFERAVDLIGAASWDANPVAVVGAYQPLYSNLNDAAAWTAKLAGTAVTAYAATLGYGAAMLGENQTHANETGGLGWNMTEIILVSATVGWRGPFGRLRDLYFGSTGNPNGSTHPDSGDMEFVQFGHVVMAWDGVPGVPGTPPDICA